MHDMQFAMATAAFSHEGRYYTDCFLQTSRVRYAMYLQQEATSRLVIYLLLMATVQWAVSKKAKVCAAIGAQAEGRAHRLGQASTVLVYQLVTRGTVEERIAALAARKRKLEALVTVHMGNSQLVTREDVQSALLHGVCSVPIF